MTPPEVCSEREPRSLGLCVKPDQLADLGLALHRNQFTLAEVITLLLSRSDGTPNGLVRASIAQLGVAGYGALLATELGVDQTEVIAATSEALESDSEVLLTGAEVIALLLFEESVTHVFSYPGTSELALCDAIATLPQPLIVNGRGDAECVFIAAGNCLFRPGQGVAILHGARGSTNALGAIALARRNEVGVVCIVGMASRSSQEYLPPHAERNLLEGVVHFAKAGWELPGPLPNSTNEQLFKTGERYVALLREAFAAASALSQGPIIVGLPQDIAERAWIPLRVWHNERRTPRVAANSVGESSLAEVMHIITTAKQPLVLIDDPLFRFANAREALTAFCQRTGSRILQVAYRRGPMLFEQFSTYPSNYYLGLLDRTNPIHRSALDRCDLIVTVEDRNMYQRVVGQLPAVPKIAINSNPEMVVKNAYLEPGDLLLAGDPVEILQQIVGRLPSNEASFDREIVRTVQAVQSEFPHKFNFLREIVPRELGRTLAQHQAPILVDDSQMFGGLISEKYRQLPNHIRVFGDHSGFVGAGLGLAVGLAISQPHSSVWCLVGDQAFTNGFQSLVCAGEQGVDLKILLCDNGQSVSLLKQSRHSNPWAFEGSASSFLENPPSLDYLALARAVGLQVFDVVYNINSPELAERDPTCNFQAALTSAAASSGPILIRLKLPCDPDAWEGIWATKGLDGF